MERQVRVALTVLLATLLVCGCSTVLFASGVATGRYLAPENGSACHGGLSEIAVPPGTPVSIEKDGLVATLTDVTRPADEIVAGGSDFNPKPEAGQEFIRVKFTVACEEEHDGPCSFIGFDLVLIGTRGVYGRQMFIMGVEGDGDLIDIPAGEERSGAFYFLVPKEDEEMVLVYKGMLGDGLAYFALEE